MGSETLGIVAFKKKNYFMKLIFLYNLIFPSKLYSFIDILYIFGHAESLLLHAGFLHLWRGVLFVGMCRLLVGVVSFGRVHRP